MVAGISSKPEIAVEAVTDSLAVGDVAAFNSAGKLIKCTYATDGSTNKQQPSLIQLNFAIKD